MRRLNITTQAEAIDYLATVGRSEQLSAADIPALVLAFPIMPDNETSDTGTRT